MMLNIHEAFEDQINEAKWLDEASKTKTLYKARRMKEILAYPDFVMNSTELDYYYSDVFHNIFYYYF